MEPVVPACAICGNAEGHSVHLAREMMFGFRESFRYLECGHCRCLQLIDVPPDMSRYYPPNYYSFAPSSGLRDAITHRRSAYAYGQSGLAGWLAAQLLGPDQSMEAIRRAGVPLDARVLDVGCGSGSLLRGMKRLGYRSVCGVDPFLPQDLHHPDGVTILKRSLEDMTGAFDLVMSHHAFEHMPDPSSALAGMRRLLAPGGRILIRIPVADSYAWRHYGVHWVNLDAPRHIFLHTPSSMRILAERHQLVISQVRFDGNASQFLGSEQYKRDIPLSDPRSVYAGGWRRWVGWWRAKQLQSKVRALNEAGTGDWACFELTAQL